MTKTPTSFHRVDRIAVDAATGNVAMHFISDTAPPILIALSDADAHTLRSTLETAMDTDWVEATRKNP